MNSTSSAGVNENLLSFSFGVDIVFSYLASPKMPSSSSPLPANHLCLEEPSPFPRRGGGVGGSKGRAEEPQGERRTEEMVAFWEEEDAYC